LPSPRPRALLEGRAAAAADGRRQLGPVETVRSADAAAAAAATTTPWFLATATTADAYNKTYHVFGCVLRGRG